VVIRIAESGLALHCVTTQTKYGQPVVSQAVGIQKLRSVLRSLSPPGQCVLESGQKRTTGTDTLEMHGVSKVYSQLTDSRLRWVTGLWNPSLQFRSAQSESAKKVEQAGRGTGGQKCTLRDVRSCDSSMICWRRDSR
jgi:hypothetical protein